MYKVHNIPKLLPDEHPHSYISRMAQMNGVPLVGTFIAAFFPGANVYRNINKRPIRMEPFIQPLLDSGSIDADTAIRLYERSSMGFASRFKSDALSLKYLFAVFGSGLEIADKMKLSREVPHLKFCPVCMREEIETQGFAIIHASHQIPGVKACGKHSVPLHVMEEGFNHYDNAKGFTGKSVGRVDDIDIRYACFARDFAESNFDIGKEQISETLLNELSLSAIESEEELKEFIKESGLSSKLESKSAKALLDAIKSRGNNAFTLDALLLLMTFFEDAGKLPFKSCTEDETPSHRPYAKVCPVCGKTYITNALAQSKGFGCPHCNKKISEWDIVKRLIRASTDESFTLTDIKKGNYIKLCMTHETCGARLEKELFSFITSLYPCNCLRVTEEEFAEKMKKHSPGISVLKYSGLNSEAVFRCDECGHTWKTDPRNMAYKAHSCPNKENHASYRQKMHDAFKDKVESVRKDITLKSMFEGVKKPIKVECTKCGTVWTIKNAGRLLHPEKVICPNRASHLETHKAFEKKVAEINPHIQIIGRYEGQEKFIRVKCKECGHEWSARARLLLEPRKCPKFRKHEGYKPRYLISEERFLAKLKEKHPYYELLSKYKGTKHPVTVRCTICGHVHTANAGHLATSNANCPNYTKHPDYVNPNKFSEEDFIKALAEKLPNTKMIGPYNGYEKPARFKCLICGEEFDNLPKYILTSKHGCPNYQHHPGFAKSNRVPEEIFLEKLHDINPDVEVIGEYKGVTRKVEVRCRICGHKWSVVPQSLLRGSGCPNYRKHPGFIDRNKMTEEEFLARMAGINPDIEIISPYEGQNDKLKALCRICGHKWSVVPMSLLKGVGCPNYQKHPGYINTSKKSDEEFRAKLRKINPDIEILSKYQTARKHVICLCKKCNNVWPATPDHLLRGEGCPNYRNHEDYVPKKRRRTTEEFKQILADINPLIEITGEYTTSKQPISCKCKTCGHEWTIIANRLTRGSQCPECKKDK